jgi:hypothetical protein
MSLATAMRWLCHAALPRLGTLCALALVVGCSQWQTLPEEPSQLPPARMSPDSVVLELAFVRLRASDVRAYDQIWSEADELHFSPELRRELAANGLRVGILGQQLPTELRSALDAAAGEQEERAEDTDTSDTQTSRGQRRLACRTGRRAKIVVSKLHPTLAFLTQADGAVSGSVLENAQCLLALKTYPQGDGRVRLDITPEIEHGDLKNKWSQQDGSLMQRIGRDRVVLDRLRTVATMSAGQVLVLSTTPDVKGLGEHFYSETAAGRVERTLVLIRVAQTQWDDLFAPGQMSAPLATPTE